MLRATRNLVVIGVSLIVIATAYAALTFDRERTEMVGCGGCCDMGPELVMHLDGVWIHSDDLGFENRSLRTIPDGTFTFVARDLVSGRNVTSESVSETDYIRFNDRTIEFRKASNTTSYKFLVQLSITSSEPSIEGLRPWGEDNSVGFQAYWANGTMKMRHLDGTYKDFNFTYRTEHRTPPSDGNVTGTYDYEVFNFTLPWHTSIFVSYVPHTWLCWDGMCRKGEPPKDHCGDI